MKWTHLIFGLCFLTFAYFQLNDPDPILWATYYLFISAIGFINFFNVKSLQLVALALAITGVWMVLLIPEFINWLKIGAPNIAKSMKAETPYIEFTREFLGLGISLTYLLVTWRSLKKGIKK